MRSNSRNKVVPIGLVVVALIGFAYVIAKRPSGEQRVRDAANHPMATGTGIRSDGIASRSPPVLAQRVSTPDVSVLRQRQKDALDRIMVDTAARYRREPIDPYWADAKAQELAKFADSPDIRSMNATVRNLQVDCRTSLCKITGSFPSRTAAEDWATLYTTSVGTRMPSASFGFSRNSDGSTNIEIYGQGR